MPPFAAGLEGQQTIASGSILNRQHTWSLHNGGSKHLETRFSYFHQEARGLPIPSPSSIAAPSKLKLVFFATDEVVALEK
jgi:hypothetical protein